MRSASPRSPRQAFRAAVLARDQQRCVVCAEPATAVHHLFDRALFPDGGYDPDNGVALCAACHQAAEATTLSVEYLRQRAGLTRVVLPPGFFPLFAYDKWGNRLAEDGGKFPGPLWQRSLPRPFPTRSG